MSRAGAGPRKKAARNSGLLGINFNEVVADDGTRRTFVYANQSNWQRHGRSSVITERPIAFAINGERPNNVKICVWHIRECPVESSNWDHSCNRRLVGVCPFDHSEGGGHGGRNWL